MEQMLTSFPSKDVRGSIQIEKSKKAKIDLSHLPDLDQYLKLPTMHLNQSY
jgi:hypothetical protein